MIVSIHRILLPTDFSDSAKEAQIYATELAEQFDAELHLLHVAPLFMPFADGLSLAMIPDVLQVQIDSAKRRLAQEPEVNWTKAHRVQRTTCAGNAVEEILSYAKEREIDLIVVGTHGRSGVSHAMIGSVAEKLVRMSNCPVLTVRTKSRHANSADERQSSETDLG